MQFGGGSGQGRWSEVSGGGQVPALEVGGPDVVGSLEVGSEVLVDVDGSEVVVVGSVVVVVGGVPVSHSTRTSPAVTSISSPSKTTAPDASCTTACT
ncbi:hypothetical protein ABT337_22050 [Saccharopolyspora hirsuta]|uniref:hypothetical protein n=1 Tax=Saccharopolyspora hirsuta TaxID=1837 RepID=UPI00331C4A08